MKYLNLKGKKKAHRYTHSWQNTQAGAVVTTGTVPKSGGRVLDAHGTGRKSGPQLVVTEVDSEFARELECVENWAGSPSSRRAQRDFFFLKKS